MAFHPIQHAAADFQVEFHTLDDHQTREFLANFQAADHIDPTTIRAVEVQLPAQACRHRYYVARCALKGYRNQYYGWYGSGKFYSSFGYSNTDIVARLLRDAWMYA